MKSLSTIKLGIAAKLQDKRYRHRFFRRRAQGEIATQIRDLRLKREVTQLALATAMKTGQSAVARIEDANYSGWSFRTLLKVAETLDARLHITFRPMEDVILEYENREKPAIDIGNGKTPKEVEKFHMANDVIGAFNFVAGQEPQNLLSNATNSPENEPESITFSPAS